MGDILNINDMYVGDELIELAYVGDEIVWELGEGFYSHYMSHISPMDGFYNSHSYDAIFIKDGYLYVFYVQAPHHYTDKTENSTALCMVKYDLANKSVISVSEILRPARCFWHGVEVNGTYYLFAESGTKYRLATTDFLTFTETTWTAPSSFSNMNYIIEGANNRLICTTGQTTTRMRIFYSDDLGLTWTLATGYADAVTTHGGFVHLGNGKVVLYCQDSYSGNTSQSVIDNAHATKRVVMVSSDNGETWTGSLCQNSDLVDCGVTYSSGAFCKIDDDWYFGTSRRLIEQQSGTWKLGDIRLFKGTEQDVINGTMSLFKMVDNFKTGATSIGVSLIDIQSDSGNMCMRTDGSSLYLVYYRPILHQDSASYSESTSMLCLAIVDSTRYPSVADDFYNPDWEAERDNFVSSKNTNFDLYAYGSVTNIGNGLFDHSDVSKIPSTDVLPRTSLVVPFDDEFEVVAIFYPVNRQISGSWADQYVGANIDGDVYVFGGTINVYTLNRTNSTMGAGALGTSGGRYQYFKLKKTSNGLISATLNGRTIPSLKCPAVLATRNIGEGTIVITMGDMESYLDGYTLANDVNGFKALAINTDGDVSDFYKYPVTYNGENCTFSNNATLVSGSYTCTVTPNEGYELMSLTYTMGGTAYTVTGDTITIANVTGKLIITANIAEKELELTTDGLLAWYDIGDSTTIDSNADITSKVANTYTAWTGLANVTTSTHSVPTVYNFGYANNPGSMQIMFNNTLANISNAITLEYILADNYGSFSFNLSGTNGTTWSLGYTNTGVTENNRTFSHVVVVLDNTGIIKAYINGTIRTRVTKTISNCLETTRIGVGDTSGSNFARPYLGHVRVYNKELTETEITQNYNYFVANCKVGQLAYDSSGNFVGW